MSSELAIKVEALTKTYQIYEHPRDRLKQFLLPRLCRIVGKISKQYFREFSALKDVSFDVKKGETVGIIGRNGAGKSTMLQILCGTLAPTEGVVEINGRVAALLELGSGFNPEFTGRENIYLNASILGLTKQEIDKKFDEIVKFADIGDFLDQPVKTYSSGMYVRLAFAVIVHVDAEILVVDEALAVGDAFFQAKCMSKLNALVKEGVTILFVSHDINSVKALCGRVLWLDHGVSMGFGKTVDVSRRYAESWISEANALQSQENQSNIKTEKKEIISGRISCDTEGMKYTSRSGIGDSKFINVFGHVKNNPMGLIAVQCGEQISLCCEVEALKPSKKLVIGIHIKDRNGQHLVGFNTKAMSGLYDVNWMPGERFKVTFNFIAKFQAGKYTITAVMSSLEDTVSYADVVFQDWVEDVLVMNVGARDKFPLSDWVELEHEINFQLL